MQRSLRKIRNPNHPKKGSSTKAEPLRDKQSIQKIKTYLADKPRDLHLFTFGINTALRSCELTSITVAQVAHLGVGDSLDLKQSKNGKYRRVTLNKHAVDAVQACLAIHPCPSPGSPLFFSMTNGRGLKSNTISKYMKRWCKAVGIDGNFSSHTIRKTWGYHVYRKFNGYDNRGSHAKIAELMTAYGHATERQTLEYLCIQERDISALYMDNQL